MTRNTHDRQLDHHGYDLDTDVLVSASTTSSTSGESIHAVILNLEAAITNINLDDLLNVGVASASGGALLSYTSATSSWGSNVSIVPYINPATATAADICNAMIAAGLMASAS